MNNFGSELLVRTSFLGKIPLLTRATTDDSDPTPGHMLYEINKLTFDSEIACRDTILWLNGRLKLNSATIKLKVLKIMRHLVAKGHTNFKKILRKQPNEISEASKFGGILLSIKDSAKSSQVRKEASELLEALYAFGEDCDEEGHAVVLPVMPGLGPSSSNKTTGFGNTVASKESLSDAIYNGVSGLAERVAELAFFPKAEFYEASDTSLVNCDMQEENNVTTHDAEILAGAPSADSRPERNPERHLVECFVRESGKSIFKATHLFRQGCRQVDLYKLLRILTEGLLPNSENKMHCMMLLEALHRDGLLNFQDTYELCYENLSTIYLEGDDPSLKLKAKKVPRVIDNIRSDFQRNIFIQILLIMKNFLQQQSQEIGKLISSQ